MAKTTSNHKLVDWGLLLMYNARSGIVNGYYRVAMCGRKDHKRVCRDPALAMLPWVRAGSRMVAIVYERVDVAGKDCLDALRLECDATGMTSEEWLVTVRRKCAAVAARREAAAATAAK